VKTDAIATLVSLTEQEKSRLRSANKHERPAVLALIIRERRERLRPQGPGIVSTRPSANTPHRDRRTA
jgi:hypothetical protein